MDKIILFFSTLVICIVILYDMNKWSSGIDVDVELDELDRDNIN